MDGSGEVDQTEKEQLSLWKKLRTGARDDYDSIKRTEKGFPIFVKATDLSKNWDQFRDAEVGDGKFLTNQVRNDDSDSDLFSAQVDSAKITVNLYERPPVSPSLIDDVGRGKAVATFYSQLPRDSFLEETVEDHPLTMTRPIRSSISKSTPSTRTNSSDWFIRKASARLLHSQAEMNRRRQYFSPLPGINGTSISRCESCSAILPYPLSSDQWEVHRHSIAHQLALDGPLNSPSSENSGQTMKKRKKEMNGGKVGRILLKSSNVGYIALERMGWKSGMGLGKDEWEYGLRSGRLRGGGGLNEQGKGQRGNAIIISDSEDGSDSELDIGSEAWLASIVAKKERLNPAGRREKPLDNEKRACSEEEEIESQTIPEIRPILEPIAIHMRPDRRGIGNTLPKSARVLDDERGRPKAELKNKVLAPRTDRLSKKERREMEKQKQQEWKDLRASLN